MDELQLNHIYEGDALEVLRTFPAECIDICITSPPYYKLRNYNDPGQIGLEKTPEEYIEKLVVIFNEVRRVLRPWGTLWLNMGDSYASGKGKCFNLGGGKTSLGKERKEAGIYPLHRGNVSDLRLSGLKPQDLYGIPSRLVEALQAGGWGRRSDIIWAKPSHMPESVNGWRWEQHRVKTENNGRGREKQRVGATIGQPQQDHKGRGFANDAKWMACLGCSKCEKNGGLILRKGSGRPTSSYEYIFLLTKSRSYFYDSYAVQGLDAEAAEKVTEVREESLLRLWDDEQVTEGQQSGMNTSLRNVWSITTQPYPGAHFSTFPKELPRLCILTGTSHRGNCVKCNGPWVRIVQPTKEYARHLGRDWADYDKDAQEGRGHSVSQQRCTKRNAPSITADYETVGWHPSCACGADVEPPVVLDPFFGSGTVGEVATSICRNWVGIEINKDYIKQAKRRTVMRGFHEVAHT